jgi:hypothetical protein
LDERDDGSRLSRPALSAPNAPPRPQHQHAPVPIPRPAANSEAAIVATRSSPGASASIPSLSPPVCHVAKGCSKSVRWGDLSPASSEGATSLDSRPSFKHVLVRTANPSPPSCVAAQESASTSGKPSALRKVNRQPPCSHPLSTKWWSPRQATHPTPAIRPALGLADQGWTTVESKKGRRRRLKASWLPSRAPADLVRWCFNCLGCDHQAAGCGSEPWCFLCSELGHKSFSCPKAPVWKRLGRPRPAKSVWERLSPAIEGRVQRSVGHRSVWQHIASPEVVPIVPSDPGGSMLGVSTAHGNGGPARSRCKRWRKKKHMEHEDEPALEILAPHPPEQMLPASEATACVIDWSVQMSIAEDNF